MTSKYRYIPIAGDGGGEAPVLETLNAGQNGQYFPEQGVTGWNEVNVNVPASEVDTGTLQTTLSHNGVQGIDVTGYAQHEVTVNVPASEVDSGTKYETISQNGTQTINVVGYANIELDVQVQAQAEPDYFYIENVDQNDLQTLVVLGDDNTSYTNKEIYYSRDKTNWTRMSQSIILGINDKMYFYGENPKINNEGFLMTGGDVNVGGDITCLLTKAGGQIAGGEYVFYHLFNNCTALKNADDLVIPLKEIGQWGMNGMFNGCRGLEHARFSVNIINASSLCFGALFYDCTSLIDSPSFTCTSATDRSFQYAFYGCRNLTSAPSLYSITSISNYSIFEQMFQNCTSLTTAPTMPNVTTLASSCYNHMFCDCTSLTAAPALPATTLAQDCYNGMFSGCTALTAAPTLPATTLANNCYFGMFSGCTSLTTAPTLPATSLAQSCYNEMFKNCTSLTTAPTLPATVVYASSYNF